MASGNPMFMVFDVESIGMHGEGFAVGWVVVDERGTVKSFGKLACPLESARGVREADSDTARVWLKQNVPPFEPTNANPGEMRDEFWSYWMTWKREGAMLVADCGWPVEARFLADCVSQQVEMREWDGPYPMHELASFRLAAGLDPLATAERLSNELPVHDPLADARQSARLLIEALDALENR